MSRGPKQPAAGQAAPGEEDAHDSVLSKWPISACVALVARNNGHLALQTFRVDPKDRLTLSFGPDQFMSSKKEETATKTEKQQHDQRPKRIPVQAPSRAASAHGRASRSPKCHHRNHRQQQVRAPNETSSAHEFSSKPSTKQEAPRENKAQKCTMRQCNRSA